MKQRPHDSEPQDIPMPEEPEIEFEVLFPKMFKERMSHISHLDPNLAGAIQDDLKAAGVVDIKKFAPIVIFEVGENPRDQKDEIWVEDSYFIDEEKKKYPHASVMQSLRVYLNALDVPRRRYPNDRSAFVLEDARGDRHLVVSELEGAGIQRDVSRDEDYHQKELQKLVNLIRRYGITSVIGMMPNIGFSDNLNVPLTLIDKDLVGKIRESLYLYSFAEKYHMTNTQFLRFRTLALAAKETVKGVQYENQEHPEMKPPTNYDELAQTVILDKALDEEDPFPLKDKDRP